MTPNELILAHQRLAKGTLRALRAKLDPRLDFEHLELVALEALCEAARRYDPTRTGPSGQTSIFRTYALLLIRQAVQDAAEKETRRLNAFSVVSDTDEEGRSTLGELPASFDILDAVEHSQIQRCILRLRPAIVRQVFRARAELGLSPQATAARLGISTSEVNRHFDRATHLLRRRFSASDCHTKTYHTVRALYRLDPATDKTLRQLARRQKVPKAALVRQLIGERLAA